jgi:hypothetical protein
MASIERGLKSTNTILATSLLPQVSHLSISSRHPLLYGRFPFAVSLNTGSPLPNAIHLLSRCNTGDRRSGRKTRLTFTSWSQKVYPDTRLLRWPGPTSGPGTGRRRTLTDSNTEALSESHKKDTGEPCKLVIPSKFPTSSISTSPQSLSNHATTSRLLNGHSTMAPSALKSYR